MRRDLPSPQAVPPLAEREKPGLSVTLPFPRRPDTCQACGLSAGMLQADELPGSQTLRVWLECDAWDRPTEPPVYVILCRTCSRKLIEPHARMYREQDVHAPNLGAMDLCTECPLRQDLKCTSALARQNGGVGMEVRYRTPPTYMHVRGQGFSGFRWFYPGAPIFCASLAENNA